MKKTILIVDDSESIRELISLGLTRAGFEVIAAENGSQGLSLLEAHPPVKLVITDLNMPLMDGITFLKELRGMPKHKFLPVIILTTESQHTRKMEAKNAGATGWIIKPFTNEQLLEVIKKVIR